MTTPDLMGFTGAESDASPDAAVAGSVTRDISVVAGSWSSGSWRCNMNQGLTALSPFLAAVGPTGYAAESGSLAIPLGYQRAYSTAWRFHLDGSGTSIAVIEDRESGSLANRLVLQRIGNLGQLVLTDKNGSQLSNASKPLAQDTWYRLNAVLSPKSPTSYYLWIDGELQLTAFSFAPYVSASGDVQMGDLSKSAVPFTFWFDDTLITARAYTPPSVTTIFDARIRRLLPSGAGAIDQWALGATPPPAPPNSWTALRSNDEDGSFVESQTLGEQVLNAGEDVPPQSASQSVRHFLVLKGVDTAAAANVTSMLRQGAFERLITPGWVATSYQQASFIHSTAPDGGAWDDAKVNDAQVGASIAVGGQRFRITQQGMMTSELKSGPHSVPRGQATII